MNILHISRSMGQGGAQKIVLQLCEDNTHHKNHYVISNGGIYTKNLEVLGVKHFFMPDLDNKNLFNMLVCLIKILRVVSKNKIDIVHTHHRMAAFYARICLMLYPNVKHIYTAHNVFYNKKKLLRFSLSNAAIVAVGDGVKKNLMGVYRLNSENIMIIYNSIKKIKMNENYTNTLNSLRGSSSNLVGCIGRLSKQKGIDIFLRAMHEVVKQNPNIIGVIIGEGEEYQNMENLVSNLEIEKNIVFMGYQEYIFELIMQLDFIVLPSRWEGFPLTPIEAFSVGKSVIASNIDGNNEIVINNYNGLLFESENSVDLSEKIMKLCKDEELKNNFGRHAMSSFRDKYSYEMFKKRYNALYEKL